MNKTELITRMNQSTILYVEDELDIRNYIVEFLQRYFKTIYEASSSEEGYLLYEKYQPDIMLLDINLPGQNGIDFASRIRREDNNTRIIMTTAYTNKEFMLKAIELNLTRYLVKPVIGKDLLEAIEKAFQEISNKAGLKPEVDLGEGFVYNIFEKQITHHGEIIQLRKKEVDLLEFFIQKKNHIVTYNMLETQIWHNDVMTQDAIRSQIRNLRKKTYSKILKNISGIGYKLYTNQDNEKLKNNP